MSKSIEYILTSITTKEYIISKVLSMCLIVVLQFVFMLAYLLIAVMISSLFTLSSVNIDGAQAIDISGVMSLKLVGYIAITFVFMCLTTFLQGVIQSVMSAKTQIFKKLEMQQYFLVTLNLVLYTIVTVMISPLKSASVIAYIVSVLPIASMYFIPAMFVIGQANIFQVIISLIILVASIPLSLILAQKPFKNAILDYSPKKNKKIEGIEKIIATREYQERMIDRKESSKKGLTIGLAGNIINYIASSWWISNKRFYFSNKSKNNIYFTRQYISNTYVHSFCIINLYTLFNFKKHIFLGRKKQEISKEEKKVSIVKCIKYIIVSIPIISVIQMICSFAVEKIGLGADVSSSIGLFNYSESLQLYYYLYKSLFYLQFLKNYLYVKVYLEF